MDNIITMRSGDRLIKGANEQWKDKAQSRNKTKHRSIQLGQGVHKKNGVYWFNNRKIKDLIAFCRKENLIIAPDSNRGPNNR
tara:strand:+ start:173 stop:418 length:246 start_codon:yes stop_codon:yes gene_type:complete